MVKKPITTLVWPYNIASNRPFVTIPSLSMLYLAKVLEINDFDVNVIDSEIFFESKDESKLSSQEVLKKTIQNIEKTNPDIVGIGSWTDHMPLVSELARELKARNPNIFLILGGYNPTFLPNETLELMPFVDCLVRGEGEYTLLEIVQKISKKESHQKTKGISFIKNGEIIHTENRPLIERLDDLPLLDLENYITKPNYFSFPLQNIRGCPYDCSFCSIHAMWGRKIRFFSPKHVINQIKHLLNLYDNINFNNADNNSLTNINYIKKISNNLHNSFSDLNWGIAARIDNISRELFVYLKSKGLSSVCIGLESTNEKSLIFLKKTGEPKKYINKALSGIKILNELEIQTQLSCIVGSPNETEEEIMKFYSFLDYIRNNFEFVHPECYTLALFPGTELWSQYMNSKITVYSLPFSNHPFHDLFEKYKHLVWMVPSLYRIKSNEISVTKFEKILSFSNKFRNYNRIP